MVDSLYSLGGYFFSLEDAPQHDSPGDMGRIVPKNIQKHNPIGAQGPGATIRQYIGDKSPLIPLRSARMTPAAVTQMETFYGTQASITFKSPWNQTGFLVVIDSLTVKVIKGYVPNALERYEVDMVLERR